MLKSAHTYYIINYRTVHNIVLAKRQVLVPFAVLGGVCSAGEPQLHCYSTFGAGWMFAIRFIASMSILTSGSLERILRTHALASTVSPELYVVQDVELKVRCWFSSRSTPAYWYGTLRLRFPGPCQQGCSRVGWHNAVVETVRADQRFPDRTFCCKFRPRDTGLLFIKTKRLFHGCTIRESGPGPATRVATRVGTG